MGSRTSFVGSADNKLEDSCAVMGVLSANLGPDVAVIFRGILAGSAKGGYPEDVEIDIDVSYREEIEAVITQEFILVTLDEMNKTTVIEFMPGGAE